MTLSARLNFGGIEYEFRLSWHDLTSVKQCRPVDTTGAFAVVPQIVLCPEKFVLNIRGKNPCSPKNVYCHTKLWNLATGLKQFHTFYSWPSGSMRLCVFFTSTLGRPMCKHVNRYKNTRLKCCLHYWRPIYFRAMCFTAQCQSIMRLWDRFPRQSAQLLKMGVM